MREYDIQRAVVSALRSVLPGAIIHHSPNELRANGRAAQRAQALRLGMGMLAGWPDVVVLAHGRVLFLEVKGPAGRLSPAQREFRDRALAHGFGWALVRSVDDALEALVAAGFLERVGIGYRRISQ